MYFHGFFGSIGSGGQVLGFRFKIAGIDNVEKIIGFSLGLIILPLLPSHIFIPLFSCVINIIEVITILIPMLSHFYFIPIPKYYKTPFYGYLTFVVVCSLISIISFFVT
jgi:hypothetical protein